MTQWTAAAVAAPPSFIWPIMKGMALSAAVKPLRAEVVTAAHFRNFEMDQTLSSDCTMRAPRQTGSALVQHDRGGRHGTRL